MRVNPDGHTTPESVAVSLLNGGKNVPCCCQGEIVMGDSTIQPTNHPANQPTDHPAKNKKLNAATLIALASAATAIAAVGISLQQADIADRQNTAAEQQQLVNLTTHVAEQFAQEQTAAITANLEVEGQEGAVLIDDLHGKGVASVEYIQVARALENVGHGTDAIKYYKAAVNALPHDAETRASALRYLATIYYNLGQPVIAHRYAMRAVTTFNGHQVEPAWYEHNSIAQAYLLDASYQIDIKGGCPMAARDKAAAQNVIGSYGKTALVQSLMADLKDANKSGSCGSG
jgi:tetratricopeptide (TPR) repeat protein